MHESVFLILVHLLRVGLGVYDVFDGLMSCLLFLVF